MFFSKLTKILLSCFLILSVNLNCNPKRKVRFPKWLVEKYPTVFKQYTLEQLLEIEELLKTNPLEIDKKTLANIIVFNNLCQNYISEESDSEDADSEGDTTD